MGDARFPGRKSELELHERTERVDVPNSNYFIGVYKESNQTYLFSIVPIGQTHAVKRFHEKQYSFLSDVISYVYLLDRLPEIRSVLYSSVIGSLALVCKDVYKAATPEVMQLFFVNEVCSPFDQKLFAKLFKDSPKVADIEVKDDLADWVDDLNFYDEEENGQ